MQAEEEAKGDAMTCALLQKMTLIHPVISCPSGHPLFNACTDRSCGQRSLFCDHPQCPNCAGKHSLCQHVRFEAITELLTKRGEYYKDFILKMIEVENRLIDMIMESRKRIVRHYSWGDLEAKYRQVIEDVYFRQKFDSMRGREAGELYEILKRGQGGVAQKEKDLLHGFRKETEQTIGEFNRIKEQVIECYQSQDPLNYSLVLSREPSQRIDESLFIRKSLESPKKIELLFRASQHGFSAAKFHSYCDNIPNTLVLLRTEYDRVLGGFTKQPWNSAQKGSYSEDHQYSTFMFSVSLGEKYRQVEPKYAIYCKADQGPTFGGGYDLMITDNCHKNQESYCYYPYTFDSKGKYFKEDQKTHTALCGAPEGYKFKVEEYEVYHVVL